MWNDKLKEESKMRIERGEKEEEENRKGRRGRKELKDAYSADERPKIRR